MEIKIFIKRYYFFLLISLINIADSIFFKIIFSDIKENNLFEIVIVGKFYGRVEILSLVKYVIRLYDVFLVVF